MAIGKRLRGTFFFVWATAYAEAVVAQPAFDTHFSHDRGLYDAPFAVAITADEPSAVIRYTTDASTPSRTRGEIYSGPVPISSTTVLRAIAYTATATTNVDTVTYVFLDGVISQGNAPPGYPTEWSAFPADYEMDPEVTNDAAYRSLMRPALLQIPTLSIVTDTGNLFDAATGIYQNPLGDGDAWERPTSMELIYTDGRPSFQQDAGLRIHGGASREPRNSPKHSFRLLFKAIYGDSKLRVPIFGPSAADSFDTIVLRAHYNNTWFHHNEAGSEDQRARAQYVRDQWARDLQLAMGQSSAHGFHVHLYLNGLYWGLYNVCERPEASFAASYFGGEKGDYDALNSGVAVDGDTVAWNTMMALANAGLSTPQAYADIQKYLDVDNLIDYMILNHLIGNHDWDHHNWYASRKRASVAGFRFFSWDAEHAAEDVNESRSINYNNDGNPSRLFQKLRENAEFRVRFGDRVERHFFGDGALTPAKLAVLYNARASAIETAVIAESARWGDYRRDVHPRGSPLDLYTRDKYWLPELNRLRSDYFPSRTGVVLGQYRGIQLFPTLSAPVFGQNGGRIAPGFRLAMTNPNGSGTVYYTLDGSDPRLEGGAISARAQAYTAPVALTALATVVKARIRQGSSWSALAEANFYAPQDLSRLTINEIMYHPGDAGAVDADELEFVELVNGGLATLDLTGLRFTTAIDFVFPAGTTLGPGGFLVLAANASEFQIKYGFAPDGSYLGKLANAGQPLTLVDPTGGLIDVVDYGDAPPWPGAADGGGPSLELMSTQLDNARASSWAPSQVVGGTPRAPNSTQIPPFSPLILNEYNAVGPDKLLKNGASDTYWGRVVGNGGDWFELVVTADHLDVRGFRFVLSDNGKPERLTLSQDPIWSDLRSGTVITVSEELADDVSYDPAFGDWWINVQAATGASGRYITAENFPASNDDWQIAIRDASDEVVFGPAGEGVNPVTGVGSDEVAKLEEDPGTYITPLSSYKDGSSSTFGSPNLFNAGSSVQDFSALRSVVGAVFDVSITFPAEGAVLPEGVSLTLSARARSNRTTVTQVELFAASGETVSLGVDTTAPYEVIWANPTPGSYILTAIATDDTGATRASSSIQVRVNASPSVKLDRPSFDARFPPGATIALEAAPRDADGSIAEVEFFYDDGVGTTSLGKVAGPYTLEWPNVPPGIYTLTAVARDNDGATGASASVNVLVGDPLVLIEPSGTGVSSTPTFLWKRVPEAADYFLWIAGPTGFPVLRTPVPACAEPTCSFTPATPFARGPHIGFVQARHAGGRGPWSGPRHFVVGQPPPAPVLIAPSGNGVTSRPAYSWNAASEASEYFLWVNYEPTRKVVVQLRMPACAEAVCSATPEVTLGPGQHQFWVQARNDSGDGPWSAGMFFVVGEPPGVPSLIGPTGDGHPATPTYRWSVVSGATEYYVWVNDGKGTPVLQTFVSSTVCGASICEATPPTSLVAGPHTVWVQAWNGSGAGGWSSSLHFTVGTLPTAPTPLSPSGGGVTAFPTYRWTSVGGAVDYYLWVSRFGNLVLDLIVSGSACAGGACAITPSTALSAGPHSFWIQARNAAGPGPWSNGMDFIVIP